MQDFKILRPISQVNCRERFSPELFPEIATACSHMLSAVSAHPPQFTALLGKLLSMWQQLPEAWRAAAADAAPSLVALYGHQHAAGSTAPLLFRAMATDAIGSMVHLHSACRQIGWELLQQLRADRIAGGRPSAADSATAAGQEVVLVRESLAAAVGMCIRHASDGAIGSCSAAAIAAAGLLEGLAANRRAGEYSETAVQEAIMQLRTLFLTPSLQRTGSKETGRAYSLTGTTAAFNSTEEVLLAVELFNDGCWGFAHYQLHSLGLVDLVFDSLVPKIRALMQGALSLDPFFCLAAQAAPKERVMDWAQRQQHSPLNQSAGPLVRAVADHMAAAPSAVRMRAMGALLSHVHCLHANFSDYSVATAQPWSERLQAATSAQVPLPQVLHQTLEKIFVGVFTIARAAYQSGLSTQNSSTFQTAAAPHLAMAAAAHPHEVIAATSHSNHYSSLKHGNSSGTAASAAASCAALPLWVMDLAAHLQFCRVALPDYPSLLADAVSQASVNPQACEQLLELLPRYDWLVAPVPSQASALLVTRNDATYRWQVDSVLLSKVLFVFPVLPMCAAGAYEPAAAVRKALPAVYLFLQHSNASAALASHVAFAALLAAAAKRGCHELVEQSVPFYLQRALQDMGVAQPPQLAQAHMRAAGAMAPDDRRMVPQGLSMGLQGVFRHTRSDSAIQLLCFRALLDKCRDTVNEYLNLFPRPPSLAAVPTAVPAASYGIAMSPSSGQTQGSDPEALLRQAEQLFCTACWSLSLVSYELLPTAAKMVRDAVLDNEHPPLTAAFIKVLYSSVLQLDDYIRKPQLVKWFYQLWSGLSGHSLSEIHPA